MNDRADRPSGADRPPDAVGWPQEVERLRRDLERVERERDRLRREVGRWRGPLEAARRAGFRQAAPFSKGPSGRPPRRPGRKAGLAYGRQGQRPTPIVVDDVHDVPVPASGPRCGAGVEDTHVLAQYQEDLPPVRPVVRRFDVHIGRGRRCGRRVQGRHPLQTSDAVGAAARQLGPQALAVAASFNKELGLSFSKMGSLFADRFGLRVTRGALVRAVHRVAAKAQPTYTALCETVKTSAMVVADETGWRVHAARPVHHMKGERRQEVRQGHTRLAASSARQVGSPRRPPPTGATRRGSPLAGAMVRVAHAVDRAARIGSGKVLTFPA